MSVLNKKGLIVILIYFVIAASITGYFIYKSHSTSIGKNDSNEYTNESGVFISKDSKAISNDANSLYDKYSINNIKLHKDYYIDEVKLDEGVNPYEMNYKTSVQYITVEGIKDKTIENNINTKIKSKVDNIVNHINNQNKSKSLINYSVSCYDTFNNANILSISFVGTAVLDTFDENESDTIDYCDSITFNLVNGNEIKFEDVFTDTAPIKSIIRHIVYRKEAENLYDKKIYERNMEATDPSQVFDDFNSSFKEVDYPELENIVFKKMSLYNETGITNFAIYNGYLSFDIIDGYGGYYPYYINFIDYYEYVKLYNIAGARRGLYDAGDLPIENFVYMHPSFTYSLFNGKLSKNSYLFLACDGLNDYTINNDYSKITKLRNTRYVKNFINSFREFHDLNNDPETYYFYVAYLSNDINENNEFIIDLYRDYNVYVDCGIYKSSNYEDFESDVNDTIVECNRRIHSEGPSMPSPRSMIYYREYENNALIVPNLIEATYTNFGLDADGNIFNYDKIYTTVTEEEREPRTSLEEEERNTTIIPNMEDNSPASLAPELDNNYDPEESNGNDNNGNNSNNNANNNPNYQYMTIVTEYSSNNQNSNQINNNVVNQTNQDNNQYTNTISNTVNNTIGNIIRNQVYNNVTQ